MDYTKTFTVKNKPKAVAKAILEEVGKWWTASANKTEKVGDVLLTTFDKEKFFFMKMKVYKIVPNKSVQWVVLDDNIGVNGVIVKGEWVGTKIKWDFKKSANGTIINFEHKGLNKNLQCYDVCENGWNHYLYSFEQYLNTGVGNPAIN
jgi:hypothetical protein